MLIRPLFFSPRFLVRVSYLEIYNEEVRDLLGKDQSSHLEVKERPDIGVYVKDLSSVVCHNADDMDRIMSLGNRSRSVGATNMNERSSRSHAIFSVTLECSDKGPDGAQRLRAGKLHLVDLAGSERQSKTGATGMRLKEATKINLSLSTLGNVISALVDGKSTHIPYRNSKLTRLLQDSLGGNSKTVMIANVGPADYNYDESISTLRYATRAKSIQNHAHVNEDPKDALLRQYQKEIEELKKQLGEGADYDGDDADSGDDYEEYVDDNGKRVKMKKSKSSIFRFFLCRVSLSFLLLLLLLLLLFSRMTLHPFLLVRYFSSNLRFIITHSQTKTTHFQIQVNMLYLTSIKTVLIVAKRYQ